ICLLPFFSPDKEHARVRFNVCTVLLIRFARAQSGTQSQTRKKAGPTRDRQLSLLTWRGQP
ncbi:hypothetical protein, partial [Polaromonas sp. CF318]|uniref:hypothetical protein n=1 Tax=Polaromonas sp. CF318 TaxID=1144318 RepID=UPI001EE65D2E